MSRLIKRWLSARRNPIVPMPSTFQIEVFAGCNLRCPLCHAGRKELDRETTCLGLDSFKQVFDKIAPYADLLYLHIWGEPTLNKHLIQMIQYVAQNKPSCVTNVSTHGNGLSREYARNLVESGLRQLIVSIDGVDQITYEKYRVGGNFEQAYQFLRDCSDIKADIQSSMLLIAQCIQMKDNIHDSGRFLSLMKIPGVVPALKPLYIGGYGLDYRHFIEEGVQIQKPTLRDCTALTDVLAIQADGKIIPCCFYPHPDKNYDLGNIFYSTVPELMANQGRWDMHQKIKSGVPPTRVCLNACGTPYKCNGVGNV